MAKTNKITSSQGEDVNDSTVVEITVARATERPKSVLLTDDNNQDYYISKQFVLDNGLVNVKQLKGIKMTLELNGQTGYNNIPFASVVDDNLAINKDYEEIQLISMAKTRTSTRFSAIINRAKAKADDKEED